MLDAYWVVLSHGSSLMSHECFIGFAAMELCSCVCGSMATWVYGYIAMWLCGFVGLWLCGYVAMWLCGYVSIFAALWLAYYVKIPAWWTPIDVLVPYLFQEGSSFA